MATDSYKAVFSMQLEDSFGPNETLVDWDKLTFSGQSAEVPVIIIYFLDNLTVEYHITVNLYFSDLDDQIELEGRLFHTSSYIVLLTHDKKLNTRIPLTGASIATVKVVEKLAINLVLNNLEPEYIVPQIEADVLKSNAHWDERLETETDIINRARHNMNFRTEAIIKFLTEEVGAGDE